MVFFSKIKDFKVKKLKIRYNQTKKGEDNPHLLLNIASVFRAW